MFRILINSVCGWLSVNAFLKREGEHTLQLLSIYFVSIQLAIH